MLNIQTKKDSYLFHIMDVKMKQGEENYATLMSTLRTSYNNGTTRSLSFRKQQLKQLFKMLEVHENDFVQAMNLDLGKSRMEAVCLEVELCRNTIRGALADLREGRVDDSDTRGPSLLVPVHQPRLPSLVEAFKVWPDVETMQPMKMLEG